MIKKTEISALFIEETGDVKCGNCGKKLLFLEKNSKKVAKSVDKQNYSAIIMVKCCRCGEENRLKI